MFHIVSLLFNLCEKTLCYPFDKYKQFILPQNNNLDRTKCKNICCFDVFVDGKTRLFNYLPTPSIGEWYGYWTGLRPKFPYKKVSQPRWLSGLRHSLVHSLMLARRSLCPEKLGSNPGQGSKGINFSGWHGLDMSITVTKRR